MKQKILQHFFTVICVFVSIFNAHSKHTVLPDSVRQELKNTNNSVQKLNLLHAIQVDFLDNWILDSVLYYGNRYLQLDSLNQEGTVEQKIEILLNNYEAYEEKGLTTKGLEVCRASIVLMEESNISDSLRAKVLCYNAFSLLDNDIIQPGIESLEASISYAEKTDYKLVLAFVNELLYFYSNGQNNFLNHLKKAAQFSEKIYDPSSIRLSQLHASFLIVLGQEYNKTEQVDSSLYYLNRAYRVGKEMAKSADAKPVYIRMLIRLSDTHAKMGNRQEAIKYIEESNNLLHRSSIRHYSPRNWIITNNFMGHVYLNSLNNPEYAKQNFLEVIRTVDSFDSIYGRPPFQWELDYLQDTYYNLFKIEQNKAPHKAIIWLEKYTILKENTDLEEAQVILEKMKKDLDFANERAELQKIQSEKEAQLILRQFYISVLILILLAVLLISFIIQRNAMNTAKLNAALEESNLKLSSHNQKLDKKNQQLNRYAHSISHDVLSKLKLIVVAGNSLIENRNTSLANYQSYYQESRSTAKWLRQYCIDLLAWAREEQHEITSSTSIKNIVQDVLYSYQNLLNQYNVEVETEGLDQLVNMPDAPFKQIVQNLIDNSIKFSKDQANPKLKIQAVQVGEKMKLSIEDNGIGLPPNLEGNLLSKSYLQNEITNKGLTIVSSIVKQYNGSFLGEKKEQAGTMMSVEI